MSKTLVQRAGTANGVAAIPGFWMDIDTTDPTHKGQSLPPDQRAALELVGALPLKPLLVVDSGHGLHVYWLLQSPWVFSGDDERAHAQDLSRRFQRYVQGLAMGHEWKLDTTSDLARVLRLPGTLNRKASPVEVRLLAPIGPRCTREDIASHLTTIWTPCGTN